MLNISKIIKDKLLTYLNKNIKDTQEFFKKPNSLVYLQIAALAIIEPLLSNLTNNINQKLNSNLTNDELNSKVKNDRSLQKLLKNLSVDDNMLSDLILSCESNQVDLNINISSGLDTNSYFDLINDNSDFTSKISSFNLSSIQNDLKNIEGFIPWILLVHYLSTKTIEFINQSEFPSSFRAKYLQKQIRSVVAILKYELNKPKNISVSSEATALSKLPSNISDEINNLLKILLTFDNIIVGLIIASSVYLNNRKKYQEISLESFIDQSKELSCNNESVIIPAASDYIIDKSPFEISLNCSTEIKDNIPIQHEPFENKSNQILDNCSTENNEQQTYDIKDVTYYDTANKAIIENISDKLFKINVGINNIVTTRTVLGVTGSDKVYSPINGIASIVQENKITVSDISDPEDNYLNETILKTQDLYKEFNNVKNIIKDFYISSLYPILLNNSPLIDASINLEESRKIFYLTGGIPARYNKAKTSFDNIKSSYENNIKTITGESNVKTKAENNDLQSIKNDLDKEDTKFYNNINIIAGLAINESKITLPNVSNFIILEYYLDLYAKLLKYFDQNDIIKSFSKEINNFIIRRATLEQIDESKIILKINQLCNELIVNTSLESTPNFFFEMLRIYNNSKIQKDVLNYIQLLSNNSKKELTTEQKQDTINTVYGLFNFYLNISDKLKNKDTTLSLYKTTSSEAIFIEGFFNNLWKRYNDIPKELNDLSKILDDLQTISTYSIIKQDDEEYRYYSINGEKCDVPNVEGDNASAFSKYEFKDINYWFKYCSFATLASVANPGSGWSTGIPPPIGPILLPVIYIPLKCFQLKWGFITLGLSICGIYVFPWVLFVNYSTTYVVPIADPASSIKKNIGSLKKSLSKEVKNFKQQTLAGYLDKTKGQIDQAKLQIKDLEERKRLNKLDKPRKPKKETQTYIDSFKNWEATTLYINEQLLTNKTNKFVLETKYRIIYDAFSGGKISDSNDQKIQSIKSSETNIDNQFKKLDELFNSINLLLAPLPMCTKPVSANFGFTLKNPKPIINFDNNLNDNINNNILDVLVDKSMLKGEDFMSTNFANKSSNSITNWKQYRKTLNGSMSKILIKDPFPKYENLKITNIPWIVFLYDNWAPTGAKTYGWPGFSPF